MKVVITDHIGIPDAIKDELKKLGAEIVELVNLPNVIATPHNIYNTTGVLKRRGDEILENVRHSG